MTKDPVPPLEKESWNLAWLHDLSWFEMRFTIIAQHAGEVPRFVGPALHGAFGHALLRLANESPEAQALLDCLQRNQSNRPLSDWTAPYVFEVELTAGGAVHPGYAIPVRMIAHPRLTSHPAHLPLLLQALRMAAEAGLGPDPVAFALDGVVLLPAPQFRPLPDRIEVRPACYSGKDILRPGTVPRRVRIAFRTPARLVTRGQLIDRMEGPILFRRLWQRLKGWYGQHAGDRLHPPSFRMIQTLEDRTHWWQASRWSSRQSQKLDLSGLVGKVVLEGLDPLAWTLLQVGEHLHVGKGTTCGLGRYDILDWVA